MSEDYARRGVLSAAAAIGGALGGCVALGGSASRVNWKKAPGDGLAASPVLYDGTVLAPLEHRATADSEPNYSITAFGARTGEERWSIDAGTRTPTRLTTADELLFYYLTDEDSLSAGDLRATAIDTRSRRWRYEIKVEASGRPLVDATTVYVGSRTGRVHSIDRQSGQRNWTKRVDSESTIASADGPGHVVVSSASGTVHALDKENGTVVWQRTEPVGGFPTAVVEAETVYVVYPFGKVGSYELASGDPHWTVSTGASAFGRSPALTRNRLLLGSRGVNESSSASMSALDRTTGEVEWSYEFENPVFPPRATDDIAVTATLTTNRPPTIAAFTSQSGERKWSYTPPSQSNQYQYAYDSPHIGAENVYTGTVDGRIFALEK